MASALNNISPVTQRFTVNRLLGTPFAFEADAQQMSGPSAQARNAKAFAPPPFRREIHLAAPCRLSGEQVDVPVLLRTRTVVRAVGIDRPLVAARCVTGVVRRIVRPGLRRRVADNAGEQVSARRGQSRVDVDDLRGRVPSRSLRRRPGMSLQLQPFGAHLGAHLGAHFGAHLAIGMALCLR